MDEKNKKIFDIKKVEEKDLKSAWNFVCVFNSIFKFVQKDFYRIDSEVSDLLKERQDAREKKDWAKSDLLRKKINEHGWHIEDAKDGQKLKPKLSKKK